MTSVLFFFFVLLIGSSTAFLDKGVKYRHHHLNRISRNSEQQRALRNIMGKLIDTETNTIYSLDGHKQQGTSSNIEATAASMSIGPSTRFLEDLACLEACYKCVEDYPFITVSF
jgi:hypothetical protein